MTQDRKREWLNETRRMLTLTRPEMAMVVALGLSVVAGALAMLWRGAHPAPPAAAPPAPARQRSDAISRGDE